MVETETTNAEINKILPKHQPTYSSKISPLSNDVPTSSPPAYVSDDELNDDDPSRVDQIQFVGHYNHFSLKYNDAKMLIKATKDAAEYDIYAYEAILLEDVLSWVQV